MNRYRLIWLALVSVLLSAAAPRSLPVSANTYSRGGYLIAGSFLGIDLDTTFYALNDAGTAYITVRGNQLEDFKAYWVDLNEPTAITPQYAVPPGEPQQVLSCRSDHAYPCMPTPDTVKAIPVPQEQWVMIGNSTSRPLKLANIFYDTEPAPGVTASLGYLARTYDAATASYESPSPVVVEYSGHPLQLGDMLRPGEGAWVWSPITYVFLESLPAQ